MTREEALATLGLSGDPDEKEIKKAFKVFAKQYHPDVNKSKDANAQFTKLTKAQEVLLNPDKYNQKSYSNADFDKHGSFSFNFNDTGAWFNAAFNQNVNTQELKPKPNPVDKIIKFPDITIKVPISWKQYVESDTIRINLKVQSVCPECLDPALYKKCQQCDATGKVRQQVHTRKVGTVTTITNCEFCNGAGWIKVKLCKHNHKKAIRTVSRQIDWDISKGVSFNKKVLFKHKGNIGHRCQPSNLFVIPELLNPNLSNLSPNDKKELIRLLGKV